MELEDILPLLACPRCGAAIERRDAELACSDASCAASGSGSYPFHGRWPVLIAFEESVIEPGAVTSTVPAAVSKPPGQRLRSYALGMARRWVRPPNRVAASNISRLLSLVPRAAPVVLVVGGGTVGNGVEQLYADPNPQVIGFDIYGSPTTQLIADAHRMPFASGTVDAVVVQAVLEHVVDPIRVTAEIRRVMKPNGVVYAETPFMQQVHAGPYDFVRYTNSGHRYLFRDFDEVASGPVAGPGTALVWSIEHAARSLFRSTIAGKIARGMFAWLRWIDPLIPQRYAMDSASAYFFLGRPADQPLGPAEVISYYRGAQRQNLGPSDHA